MNLFENEVINISRIHTVNKYGSEMIDVNNRIKHYNINLPVYELIFNLSGESRVTFGDKSIDDVTGSLRYLPKGIRDGEYFVERKAGGFCIDIYFDTSDNMPDVIVGLKNMNELKGLFLKIYDVWNSRRTGYYAECMSILYDIIKRIKLHSERYSTSAHMKKIISSYEYMMEHFCEYGFDYREMCSASGLSYDYFKELFIKHYGTSPVKYVTMLRIEKAKELLITGHYSITETAALCGYENVYYFSKVFKERTGISPKNYITSSL